MARVFQWMVHSWFVKALQVMYGCWVVTVSQFVVVSAPHEAAATFESNHLTRQSEIIATPLWLLALHSVVVVDACVPFQELRLMVAMELILLQLLPVVQVPVVVTCRWREEMPQEEAAIP
jgi:hypothetical protein